MTSEFCYINSLLDDAWVASNWEWININEVHPSNFLKFSKSDIKMKARRGKINALTNVKRSIESQIDNIIYLLGHKNISKKERWNFPKKIEFLQGLSIISPLVLRKINKKRNLLEHEYVFPPKEEVEDAIDITELFLNATEKFADKKYLDWQLFYDHENKKLNKNISEPEFMNFDFKKCRFEFTYEGDIDYADFHLIFLKNLALIIDRDHPCFLKFLKRYVLMIKQL